MEGTGARAGIWGGRLKRQGGVGACELCEFMNVL